MFAWTYQALSDSSRLFLESLPEKRNLEIEGKRILMTHGRPISHTEHLRRDTPRERLMELAEVSNIIQDPILLHLPVPRRTPGGWQAEVVWVDTFGNLSTNLPESLLSNNSKSIRVKILGKTISGMTRAFGDAPEGDLIAFIDSTGHLAIAVVNGSAKEKLGALVGVKVEVIIGE